MDTLQWCNDIHVVDSASTDGTIDIAKALGAKIYVNHFKSFAHQRNWSLDNCEIKNEWVLFLDADEHATIEFVNSLNEHISKASHATAGFYCCGKTMLGERWLKRSDNFPKWQYRLLRHGRSQFIDVGHGQKEGNVDGQIGYIPEPYLHYAFSHGFDAWHKKHLGYAARDACAIIDSTMTFKSLITLHGSKRNTAIKNIVRRVPGWPSFRFFYTYILLAGFLEGMEGLIYCRKILWYEKQVKREIKLQSRIRLSG